MAALRSKRCAASRGTISIKKTPQMSSKQWESKKEEFPNVERGMAFQAIFPPPQLRIQDLRHKKVVKFGWFRQTRKLAVGSKLADGPHVAVTWLLCKVAKFPPIPQWRVFARSFLDKIDEETSYPGYTSVKIHLPLFCELGNQICGLYSKLALYKLVNPYLILFSDTN